MENVLRREILYQICTSGSVMGTHDSLSWTFGFAVLQCCDLLPGNSRYKNNLPLGQAY